MHVTTAEYVIVHLLPRRARASRAARRRKLSRVQSEILVGLVGQTAFCSHEIFVWPRPVAMLEAKGEVCQPSI